MAIRNIEMQSKLRKHSKDAQDQRADIDVADESDSDFDDTDVFEAKTDASDNVGGSSVEIDVEQLLAEFEEEAATAGVDSSGRVRKRLEAIMERKRRHEELIDFDEYDLDS